MKKSTLAIAIQSAIMGGAILLSPQAYSAEEKEVAKQAIENNQIIEQKIAQEADEKIVVTGSRLRRDNFTVATPLVTMDKEAISDTGLGELAEILVENMPSLSYGTSNSSSQSSVSNTGITTVELRDLGANRTLTLIDGRRVVSNSKSGNYVSMSTIPTGMVKRVEVITGGASATYGADAVSGVVNIITQTDKEGFGAKVRAGESVDGGGEEFTLDLDYGTSFGDGDGYVFMSANYDKQFGLEFEDRERAAIEASWDYNYDTMRNEMRTADGWQNMADITQDQWRSRGDGTFGGVFLEKSKYDTEYWYDGQVLRNDWKDNEERYGINTKQFRMLSVPSERVSAAIKVDYDITDDIMFYSQVQWSGNYTVNDKSPEDSYEGEFATYIDRETGEPGIVELGYIPIDNPYVPTEIRETAGQYKDRIYWDRRMAEVGNIQSDNTRETVRAWAGLQGTMFDGEWDWDVSVGYGKFHQKQLRNNEFNIFRAQYALDAGYADDGVTIQCNDAQARAEGCAPLNLFGEGSISPEAADYIRANPRLDTYNEQANIMGYIAGDLFEMPAGPVSTVFGAEYRRDTQEAITDDELTYGGITWNLVPGFKGELSVAEVFAEASIPLVRDVVGVEFLSLETSYRASDYDVKNIGLVSSYKLGFLWTVGEGLNLRGNWAVAQRAPSINELYEPEAGDFDGYNDICHDTTATSDDKGHDNCRLEPGIAAEIASEGIFEDENNGYSPDAGNPELFEETGETLTIGFTYEPTFVENLSIAADYYDITITDAVDQYSNDRIVEECYATGIPLGQANQFCDAITRNSEGQIDKIVQRSYNIDELATRGVDVAMVYSYDMNRFGRLKFKLDWTHMLEHSNTSTGNEGKIKEDSVGYYDIFENKASASLAWYLDDLRIRWSASYKSDVIDYRQTQEDWEEGMAENDARCAAGEPECVADPESLAFNSLPSYIKHKISISYDIELEDDASIRVFGGVNNVFDDKGPFVLGGTGNFGGEYDSGTGRFIYLGAEIQF
ncbi:TonB-dependent receptor plug domain-containing protein [Colwellia psychrerythraea]|uniref:TonB-dependent receptor plug n=1 Tax=Colwellia psychrerythraea TaxID=28229 RepID=A0A099KD70_COLPS|nr:TonB-dependent receptor [Colwellia psychrerythraea]KGJ88321.1 TonB-dependent receptor plug [Colwellia psychrerythraea]